MRHETLLDWLSHREPRPPAGLAEGLREAVIAADVAGAEQLPEALAAVAFAMLDRLNASSASDRRVATDLLVADALMTYALEAQAERAPVGLGAFAARLAQRAGAGA